MTLFLVPKFNCVVIFSDLAAKQKVNKAKIVENILHEEDNLNMRRKQQVAYCAMKFYY